MRAFRRICLAAALMLTVGAVTLAPQAAPAASPITPPFGLTSNLFGDSITPVSFSPLTAGTDIPLGGTVDVAVTPDGAFAYAGSFFTTEVSKIDLSDQSVTTFDVGFSVSAVAISADGSTLYAAQYNAPNVFPIDIATETVGAPIAAGGNTFHMRWAPDGVTLWVPSHPLGALTAIDTSTNTVADNFVVPGAIDVAIHDDGTSGYVSNVYTGDVTPIDLTDGSLGTPIDVSSQTFSLSLTPDQATLYVTDVAGGAVAPIDTATNTLGTPILVGPAATDVDITADGTTLYATVNGNSTVVQIDLSDDSIVDTITVGDAPYGLTLFEGGAPDPCTITGTSGNDNLIGTAGPDYICAGGGRDVIRGNGGDDTLVGGSGNDRIYPGQGDDTTDGGSGTDFVDYNDIVGPISGDMTAETITGAGTDTIDGIENIRGSSKADGILGDATANRIVGGRGADTITGLGGVDNLNGGHGADLLWANDSAPGDVVTGGIGPVSAVDLCATDPGDIVTSCEGSPT